MDNLYKIMTYQTWEQFKAGIATNIYGHDYLPYGEYIFRGQAD